MIVAVRVVDTNVFSFVLRGRPLAQKYIPHLSGHSLAVSFMTVAELYEWGILRGWSPARWAALQSMLSGYVVLPADDNTCRRWAIVRDNRRGQPIAVDDAWIGAAALTQNAELVTHNPSDFQGIAGLTVISEAP
jgi:tRNA(fMet)-specific endonuclease VapC